MSKFNKIISGIKSLKNINLTNIKSFVCYKNIPSELESVKKTPYVLISSFFHLGFYTKAPGTLASFATFLIAIILANINQYLLLMFAIAAFVAGFWAVEKMVKLHKVKDPSYIVIDEVMGILIPLLVSGESIKLGFVAFVLFRFFDITKISFIKTVEDCFEGTKSIIGDDIIAGCFSLFALVFLFMFII